MSSERVVRQRPVLLSALLLTSYLSLLTGYFSPLTAVQIQDNSFLLEEAYNQERGVVQHISAYERSNSGDWEYTFTQEWPLGGIRHQVSYTLPVLHADGSGTGLGDIALNYRYQLVGHPQARVVVAPRVSLLFPTGSERQARGAGALGFQGNLPVTLVLGSGFVTHWNAGATLTPSGRNPVGDRATTATFNLAGSAVWLLRPRLNFLVEALWLSTEFVVGDRQTGRQESGFLSPGVRAAFDLRGGLQIVPGVAYTIGLGPAPDGDSLFVYLSFEHSFIR